jgi:hypothetical protein
MSADVRRFRRRDEPELTEAESAYIEWTRTLTPAEREFVFAAVAVGAEHGIDRMVELYMLILANIHAQRGG